MNTFNGMDYNDWWDDLTIEQRRAAFELWQHSEIKTIYAHEKPIWTGKGEEPPVPEFAKDAINQEEKEHDEIRKQLASKIVWDQDRFPRPLAWDEDRFKDKSKDLMTDEEFRAWLREQGQRDPSKRYG